MSFVHLHNHSEFSLLDGASRVDEIIQRAVDDNAPAVALTDHGVMYGAIDFYQAALKAGVKPLIGCELYVTPDGRTVRSGARESLNHLVLIAKNLDGYQNLMRLSSLGFIEGYYYKPRVDIELLREYSGGLIALSACLAGRIPQLLLQGREAEARDTAIELSEIFGPDHFYIEIQDHGIEDQRKVNPGLIALAGELDLPLVVTNDSHYPSKERAQAHDVLLCIQTGHTLSDEKRMKFETQEFYLKTYDEMKELFPDHPDACSNTVKIAEMCDLSLDLENFHLPDYEVPEGYDLNSYLRFKCEESLETRYRQDELHKANKQLDHELSVISDMGFPGYFLIVWDFVRVAKEKGIAVGPGRGSAAGSIVAYLLGITNVDPLKYGLLFERFLNPSRKTMPDIDIDFDDERRPEIIEYVSQKYGDDHVAQIITFGKMKARAATRDAGRVLGIPYAQVDKIAKLIPDNPGEKITIDKALGMSKELGELYKTDEEAKMVLDSARDLEGLSRQDSIHAAGVVISHGPLTDHLPIQKKGDAETVTQYSMDIVSDIGLLKMDFLGLRTLTVLRNAVALVEKNKGVKIDLDDMPLDDEATYRLISNSNTVGVFQLEGSTCRNICRNYQPTCFEDLIAILALNRPGPLQSGLVDTYIDRARGREPVDYFHPDLTEALEPVLKETYGVIVYQEQVMQMARILSGYSLAEADTLRSAIGKKKEDVLAEQRAKWIQGAVDNGYEENVADEIFGLVLKFAGYGFNKSHSTAYAVISYQEAYLKAHYTAEYMAALLSSNKDDKDKVVLFVNDCRRQNIKVLPPDVNESNSSFSVVTDSIIRFGLAAIRNVGQAVINHIIEAREDTPFASFEEFCSRVDLSQMNKRTVESLIKAGAFDSMGYTRKTLMESYEPVVDSSVRDQRDRKAGQFNLFESASPPEDEAPIHSVTITVPRATGDDPDELPRDELLANEKEMLGLYVSDHPLIGMEELLKGESDVAISELKQRSDGDWVWLAGLVTKIVSKPTKKGDTMHFVTLEDLEAGVEVIVFPKVAQSSSEILKEDSLVRIKGRIDNREDQVKLVAQEIQAIDPNAGAKEEILLIQLNEVEDGETLEHLVRILGENKGDSKVLVDVTNGGPDKRYYLGEQHQVDLSNGVVGELLEVIPEGTVRVIPVRM